MKAKEVKIAGKLNGNSLFAIIDQNGHTKCQIWGLLEEIKKMYAV